jgi:hypothetical protein
MLSRGGLTRHPFRSRGGRRQDLDRFHPSDHP